MAPSVVTMGNGSNDQDGHPAKKRRQNLSCDSCRLRRVRCEREEITQTCRSCAQRDIKCTNEQLTRPRANRGGARIAEARSRFGSNTVDGHSSPTTPSFTATKLEPDPAMLSKLSEVCVPENKDNPTPPVASSSRPRTPPRELSSGDVRAFPMTFHALNMEAFEDPTASRDLSKHLIECYRETYHYKHPCFEWDEFSKHAVDSGFEALLMPTPELEVLCLLVQAFGARISDHPLIVGENGPSRKQLPSGNLTVYGQRREKTCVSLLARASNHFNIRGIALRQPSTMGFACILTLRWLTVMTEDMESSKVRLLSALCVEHLRIFMEQGFDPPPFVRQVFWSSMGSESIMSALTGRQVQFQDSDIELYAPGLLVVTQQDEQNLFSSDEQVAFKGAMKTLFAGMAIVARQISSHLTSPAARLRGKTDPSFFTSLWDQLERQRLLSEKFSARVGTVFGSRASIMEHYLRMIAIGRISLIQVLDENFKRRLGTETDPKIIAQMSQLSQCNDRQIESAVSQLAVVFQFAESFILDPWLQKTLGGVLQKLIWRPCKEEGDGTAVWTLHEKIKGIANVLNIYYASSWAWPSWNREIALLESQLADLKRLQEQQHISIAPVPTPPPITECVFDPFATSFGPGFVPNFTDYSIFGGLGPEAYGWEPIAPPSNIH